jgi:hypothetical protein
MHTKVEGFEGQHSMHTRFQEVKGQAGMDGSIVKATYRVKASCWSTLACQSKQESQCLLLLGAQL